MDQGEKTCGKVTGIHHLQSSISNNSEEAGETSAQQATTDRAEDGDEVGGSVKVPSCID